MTSYCCIVSVLQMTKHSTGPVFYCCLLFFVVDFNDVVLLFVVFCC